MTDPERDRLHAWFGDEVARAHADLRRGVLARRMPRVRRGPLGRRVLAGGALATTGIAVVVAAALVGGLLGGSVAASPSTSVGSPGPSQGIVLGPNGIPTLIDGQRVLTPGEAYNRAAAASDASSFLVGGWMDGAKAVCPLAIAPLVSHNPWPTILIDTGLCGAAPALLPEPPQPLVSAADYGTSAVSVIFLPDGPSEPSTSDPVVMQVHAHDPQATACEPSVVPECERAIVAEAVVWTSSAEPPSHEPPSPTPALYADGIPQTFDGQPVLRPAEAAAKAAAATDSSTFLAGGWVVSDLMSAICFGGGGPVAEQELLAPPCPPSLEDSLGGGKTGSITLHFTAPLPAFHHIGPVIIRVHTHDPLAASCTPADQDPCAHAVVVDQMLWDGPIMGSDGLPAWIDGQQPLSVAQAAARLTSSTDSAPFLVRGWFDLVPVPCPTVLVPSGGAGLLPYSCPPIFIGPAPIPRTQYGATADDISLVLRSGVDPPTNGPVVLEIHGHDPGAARCAPDLRSACEAAVVVDQVVWVGP